MPFSQRLKTIPREEFFRAGGLLDSAAGAAAAAAVHEASVAEAVGLNTDAIGHAPGQDDFVNGRASADYAAVRPGFSIMTLFDLGTEVLQSIYDLLVTASPHRTGRFQRSITIYADGEAVSTPAEAASAREVVFLPLVPYARKIERGQSPQAPDGVFQGVAAIAAQRYGNQARILFTYREPVGGANALEAWARDHAVRAAEGAAAQRRQYLKDVRQPAVIVTFK